MDRTLFTTLTLFALFAGFAALVVTILLPFFPSIGWGVVIAVITSPIYRRLRRLLRGNDTTAAAVMTTVVAVTICLPLVAVIMVIANEAASLYRLLEESGTDGILRSLSPLLQHPLALSLKERLDPFIAPLPADIASQILPALKRSAGFIAATSAAAAKNIATLFFQIFFMTIILFFIYRDGERINDRLWDALPIEEGRRELIEGTIRRVFQAVIFGMFLTCVVQGILGGLGFWVTGLPSPILFGSIMIVTAFIPVVGTALIWAPGGIYLILQGKMIAGVGLLLWGGVVVGSIDNLIRPLFISGRANLPILLVALGALGGLVAFGLIGVVFGPLILAIPFELIRNRFEPVPSDHVDP